MITALSVAHYYDIDAHYKILMIDACLPSSNILNIHTFKYTGTMIMHVRAMIDSILAGNN